MQNKWINFINLGRRAINFTTGTKLFWTGLTSAERQNSYDARWLDVRIARVNEFTASDDKVEYCRTLNGELDIEQWVNDE